MQPASTSAPAPGRPVRIAGIDIARGLAIYLMFQSHTVKGLLFFKDMPEFGVVPMHTVTKFSSSLFILVFGVTLGVIFAPRTLDEERWPKTRNHLWWRALLVLFWYKVLTVLQTFQTRRPDVIVDMLLYKKFPDFVEILDFYSWMLLFIPLLLPLWRRLPLWAGPLIAAALAGLGQLLAAHWDFLDWPFLKAILVEDDKLFCFGLLTRGPLAMLGLFIGDVLGRAEEPEERRWHMALACIGGGLALLGLFYGLYHGNLHQVAEDIARNIGKHPPQLFFMTFSVGGSLVLLGLCLFIGSHGPLLLKPLEILGRESLATFVWHIVAIFVGLRWLFDLKRQAGKPKVSYDEALMWTGAVTVTAIGVAMLNTTRKRWQKERKAQRAREEAGLMGGQPQLAPDPAPGATMASQPRARTRARQLEVPEPPPGGRRRSRQPEAPEPRRGRPRSSPATGQGQEPGEKKQDAGDDEHDRIIKELLS